MKKLEKFNPVKCLFFVKIVMVSSLFVLLYAVHLGTGIKVSACPKRIEASKLKYLTFM